MEKLCSAETKGTRCWKVSCRFHLKIKFRITINVSKLENFRVNLNNSLIFLSAKFALISLPTFLEVWNEANNFLLLTFSCFFNWFMFLKCATISCYPSILSYLLKRLNLRVKNKIEKLFQINHKKRIKIFFVLFLVYNWWNSKIIKLIFTTINHFNKESLMKYGQVWMCSD